MSRPKNSLMIINSASNHSSKERQKEDFYATPPRMVKYLLNHLYPNGNVPSVIWEPANGLGHVSNVIAEYAQNSITILKSDIVQRTDDTQVLDFLSINSDNIPDFLKPYENSKYPGTYNVSIITNPPYFKGTEFLEKACELIAPGEAVCFFVKLQYLETKKRYEVFKKYKPWKILVSVQRVHCGKDGKFDNKEASGGAACYCWYIFVKGYNGPTMLDWINTGEEIDVNNSLF